MAKSLKIPNTAYDEPNPAYADPSSLAFRAEALKWSQAVRDQIARDGDFIVDMGDGKGERPVSAVLDELDANDVFVVALERITDPNSTTH